MKKWFLWLLCAALLWGCTPAENVCRETVFAMDTVMDLQIWGPDGQTALTQVKELLRDLEKTWSATDEDSLLSRLNRGQGSPSASEQAVLDLAVALQRETNGAFDPKLHEVLALWGFQSKAYSVPDSEALTAASREQWDLGGLLKGLAGAEAVKLLEALEIDRAILNLGGNVQTYGEKPDGSPWKIAIEDPEGGDPVGWLAVYGTAAVVTSGDYQRYFEQDGKRYHHILDPETGCPADSGLRSVTVICGDGARADALSTALFVMGLEEAVAYWRENEGFEAVFITAQGQILATEGALFSGEGCEVIAREN